uniref:C-X-C motif chemokine 16 n=2 Tax=Felis catus TaxID=9685 RepID=A0ABI7Z3K1_FELCA
MPTLRLGRTCSTQRAGSWGSLLICVSSWRQRPSRLAPTAPRSVANFRNQPNRRAAKSRNSSRYPDTNSMSSGPQGPGPRLSRGTDVWRQDSGIRLSRGIPPPWIGSAGSPRGPSPSRPLRSSGTCSRHHFSKEGAASSRSPLTRTRAHGTGRNSLDAALRCRRVPDMRRPWGLRSLALLLLLELLPRPGDGNEGSVTGSCYCGTTISSDSPPKRQLLAHLRKHLKVYHRCNSYIRFQLPVRSVCGGSRDQWVQELMSCFDLRECGHVDAGSAASRQHSPPPSSQVPEPTETAPLDPGSPAQTHLPPAVRSTQAPTLPAGAPSSDEKLAHINETATPTVGHGLGAGPEAGEKQKQLEDNVGPTSGTPATVPVVSLLAITLALTVVLSYILCQRRREQCRQQSPDLQLRYTLVASDSNA